MTREQARRGEARQAGLDLPVFALGEELLAIESLGVLVRDDHVAGRRALLGRDDRPGQEPGPQPEPALAVLAGDRLLIAEPVVVPPLDRRAVVDADRLLAADLEAGRLELVDHPTNSPQRIMTEQGHGQHMIGGMMQAENMKVGWSG